MNSRRWIYAITACMVWVLATPLSPCGNAAEIRTRKVKIPGLGKVEAEDGKLTVPEVRSKEGSRHIDLAYVRLRSPAEKPMTPLIYLAGGPGQGATGIVDRPAQIFWRAPWLQAALEVGDVILLDQRGAGKSEPDLSYRWDGPLPLEAFSDADAAMRHVLEMSRRARAAIVERGIDPDGYTTEESADDVNALRQALGLNKVSLLGFSYGTHLALSVLRRHGEHIDRAVLSGVEGPDHTFKPPMNADIQFRRLAAAVAADPEIGAQIPDLYGLLERVLRKLEAEPMRIALEAPDGSKVELPIGPFGLMMILRFDIGDASDLPVFPRLLWSIDQGDPDVLAWFVRKRARRALGTHGMNMLMDGSSGASAERLALLAAQAERSLFRDVVNFPYPQALEVWQPRMLGAEFRAPLISTVPTLFLSGTLDWNTPPSQAEEVRWGFTDSIHLIVGNAGHEQVLPHPDVKRALAKFLRGDDDVAEITASYARLRFVPLQGSDPEVTHPSVSRG